MKYLFFDIESSNGRNECVCEFGYVLTDEQFNLLEQKVFKMNPKGNFNTGGKVKLYFKKQEYENSPIFPYYYKTIKQLLTNPNYVVFGYSVAGDIRFINASSKRYDKPKIDFRAYDVQKIYQKFKNLQNQISLEKATANIPKEDLNGIYPHRSDCDAKMTMLVLKHLVKENNIDITKLVKENRLYEIQAKSLAALNGGKNSKIRKEQARDTWSKFVSLNDTKEAKSNKETCFLSNTFKKDAETVNYIITKVKKNGYRPVRQLSEAKYIIVRDLNDKERFINLHSDIKTTVTFIVFNRLI